MSALVPAGYYITPEATVIRVTVAKAGTHSWAERMVVENGRLGWVPQYGLGTDLVIAPLTPRAVSARVRTAMAAAA